MDAFPDGLGWFETTFESFSPVKMPPRMMNYRNNYWTAVTYEINSTQTIYTRQDYGAFDLLSDIGGIFPSLLGIGSIGLGLILGNGPFMLTVSRLIASPDNLEEQGLDRESGIVRSNTLVTAEDVQKDCCLTCRLRCGSQKCCGKLKMTKADMLYLEAQKDVRDEFYVTNVIKNIRAIEGILKEKYGEDEWETAKSKHSLYQIKQEDIDKVKKEGGEAIKLESFDETQRKLSDNAQ